MKEKVQDIKKALEAKAYLSALGLTLTLPDICGKLEHPEFGSRKRYVLWFDKYVKDIYNSPETNPPEVKYPVFDGEMCYKLRCAFLHAGNTEEVPVDCFELSVDGCDRFGIMQCNDNEPEQAIRLDIDSICKTICSAVLSFYMANKEKIDFPRHHTKVVNIWQEWKKIRSLNEIKS